jgi:hypothetical protein
MAVKARFWIRTITRHANTETSEVILGAVTRKTGDNVDWSKFTPSGELKLFVTNDGAREWFDARLGKDIALTFDDPDDAE